MAQPNPSALLADWLRSRGYTSEEIERILARLADKDHKTLSDALFDSIGNNARSLDQIIHDLLK